MKFAKACGRCWRAVGMLTGEVEPASPPFEPDIMAAIERVVRREVGGEPSVNDYVRFFARLRDEPVRGD